MHRRRIVPLVVAVAALAALAVGPIYKWVDEQGNVHYSDQPPPEERESEELVLLPAPDEDEVLAAQARLDRLLAEQQAGREDRATEREQRRLQQELEEAQRVQRLRRCVMARQNLHILEIRRPVYSIDEQGEYVFLDDQQRMAVMQRMREEIDAYCD